MNIEIKDTNRLICGISKASKDFARLSWIDKGLRHYSWANRWPKSTLTRDSKHQTLHWLFIVKNMKMTDPVIRV